MIIIVEYVPPNPGNVILTLSLLQTTKLVFTHLLVVVTIVFNFPITG